MIKSETFTTEHINEIKGSTRVDPSLLERSIYAMGLLEALAGTKMPFVFKGGTSLMLLLESPRRLSVDIDIVVSPGTDIYKYIDEAGEIFPFMRVEEQVRKGRNNIEKKHFRFFYQSPVSQREFYILLDVLFEENLYAELIPRMIQSDFLLTEAPYVEVSVPSANCLLGDKLTAFAPHTTGIPFDVDKDVEIIKQFYDIGCLMEISDDTELVRRTYESIARAEINYRGGGYSSNDALMDTIETALCIVQQGVSNSEEFQKLKEGIRGIATYIYAERYSVEKAIPTACQIIYLSACLLRGEEFRAIMDGSKYVDGKIENKRFSKLSYLKKIDPVSFGYIVEAAKLLK